MASKKTKKPDATRPVKKLEAQLYVLKKRDFTGVAGQRLQILTTIKDQGGKASRQSLLSALSSLKTKQAPEKILAFYRGKLVKEGFVEVKTAA